MNRALGISLFVITLVLASCSTKKNSTPNHAETQKQAELTEKEQLDFAYIFFEAEKDKLLGNLGQAKEKFSQAIRINPRSSAAHFELSQIYLQTGELELAEQSGKQAIRFDDTNKWYKMSMADILERNGKYKEIIPLLDQLSKMEPGNPDYLLGMGAAQTQLGDFSGAIKTYDRLEKVAGLSEELALQKKSLYLRMQKPEKAIEEIQKLMALYPEEIGYRGFIAEIYEATNQPQKALEVYKEILELDPNNPNVHFSLAEYYRREGNKEESFKQLKKAFENPAGSIELKLQVLSSYFEIIAKYPELKDQAFELCEIMVATHREEPQSHAVYGDFLLREGKLNEARDEYRKVLEADKSKYTVWNQVLLIEAELQNYDTVFSMSAEAIELFPYQPNLFLYRGIAAMQLKNYEDAISALRDGANVTISNPGLSAQFYASMGDSYNYLRKYRESDEAYEKALGFEKSNTYVLNNYAYYLSLRKENLERAVELATECNAIQPGNPSFEDTFAWVLFQKGDYEAANTWIDKAINSGGIKSATIMEHKGDILFKNGKLQDALDFWKRAKDIGGGSTSLDEKINQKKYIE